MGTRRRLANGHVIEVDYIVVGSGSAGSVVAGRLSQDPQTSVLLLEAGGSDRSLRISMPGLSQTTIYGHPKFDWGLTSEPDPTRNNRRDFMPRGKVLGGTSAINSMSYVRGSREDFDDWARLGNSGWDFDSVLPYFKKSEHFATGVEHRGRGGPQPVSKLPTIHPLSTAFIQSCVRSGVRFLDDINDPSQEGVGYNQVTQRRGARYSAARSYIRPATHKKNITVLLHSHVTRVLLEDRRATGVEFFRDDVCFKATARRGVVLSAGAFGSPQLLMLSGIGPADHLKDIGVDVRVDLPGVGMNLQDHAGTAHVAYVNTPTYNTIPAYRIPFVGLQWLLTGRGPASSPMAQVVGAHHLDVDGRKSRLQVLFSPGGYVLSKKGVEFLDRPAVTGLTNVHRPYSSGWVRLRSRDPRDSLAIQPNLLEDERDIDTLIRGHALMRTIFSNPPLSNHVLSEYLPGPSCQSRADLTAFIRANALGVYHPSGTCKMGIDPLAVVDPQLRVRGVSSLYVADASIMPFIVSANLSANCIMIGERLADWLR